VKKTDFLVQLIRTKLHKISPIKANGATI